MSNLCVLLMSELRKLGLVIWHCCYVMFKKADAKVLQQKLSGKGCQDDAVNTYLSLITTEYVGRNGSNSVVFWPDAYYLGLLSWLSVWLVWWYVCLLIDSGSNQLKHPHHFKRERSIMWALISFLDLDWWQRVWYSSSWYSSNTGKHTKWSKYILMITIISWHWFEFFWVTCVCV